MPFADPEHQRMAVRAHQARNRKAWLESHPCVCGAPSAGVVSAPGHAPIPKGIWSWRAEKRVEVLDLCIPLCGDCRVKWQRRRLDGIRPRPQPTPARVSAPKSAPKVPRPKPVPKVKVPPAPKAPEVTAPLSINPRTTKAKQSHPKPVSDLLGDMEAAVKRADRRAWREKRREEQGYG